MLRRRGAVSGHRGRDQVVEVGLDELLSSGEEDTGDERDLDERQGDQPGVAGASFGAAFFGWLVASGTAVLLVALAGGACTLIGWNKLADWSKHDAGWFFVGAWIVLVLSLGIGAFSGGYASGRMVPSQGRLQGLDVWIFSWCAAGVLVGVGYVVDRKYDLVARIDWSALPIATADRTRAAVVALVAILLVTLVGAVLGGAAGNKAELSA